MDPRGPPFPSSREDEGLLSTAEIPHPCGPAFTCGEHSVAVYRGSRKLIEYDEGRWPSEVFDLAVDPLELRDLAGSGAADELTESILTWRDDTPEGVEHLLERLDEETERQLRALGYLGD